MTKSNLLLQPHPYTEAASQEWVKFCQNPENWVRSGIWTEEGGSQGEALPTGYVITVDNEATGSIGLAFGSDVYFRTAELGYWLGEDHWGKGIMSKVVPAFVQWTWEQFDILVRLNGETNETNLASASLLKKAGFACEGIRPNLLCKNGQILSAYFWGALKPTSSGK